MPGGTTAAAAAAINPVQLAAASEPCDGAFLRTNAIRPLPRSIREGTAGSTATLPDHQLITVVITSSDAAATTVLTICVSDL